MSLIYLYGFAPSEAPMPEQGLLGVVDTEVEAITEGAATAVVSRVPESVFAGENLERHCADVDWMASLGLSHEQVVAWFVDHASILPSRLLTLFSSESALREAMARESDRIRGELDRFAGLREWDLRVGFDADRLTDHLGEVSDEVAGLDREIEAASPGKRFLLEKKRKDLAGTETRAAARRLSRGLLDTLSDLAVEVTTLDPPADQEPTTLNGALLVEQDREAELRRRVEEERERLEPLGLNIRFTGPWAPYRFMGGPDDE